MQSFWISNRNYLNNFCVARINSLCCSSVKDYLKSLCSTFSVALHWPQLIKLTQGLWYRWPKRKRLVYSHSGQELCLSGVRVKMLVLLMSEAESKSITCLYCIENISSNKFTPLICAFSIIHTKADPASFYQSNFFQIDFSLYLGVCRSRLCGLW